MLQGNLGNHKKGRWWGIEPNGGCVCRHKGKGKGKGRQGNKEVRYMAEGCCKLSRQVGKWGYGEGRVVFCRQAACKPNWEEQGGRSRRTGRWQAGRQGQAKVP